MSNQMRPVWYLPGPFYQYNEDVKALATAAGVRIIDATVTDSRDHAADPDQLPTVTLKSDGQPAPVAAVAPAAPAQANSIANLGKIEIAPGVTIAPADLEAKAIEASGLTAGKFKQLKRLDREQRIVQTLDNLKAVEAARALGQ